MSGRRFSNSRFAMPRTVGLTFTHDEVKRLEVRFRKLDRDQSGTLSLKEVLALPGLPKTELIKRVFQVLDTDGDQEIDFGEFIEGLSQFSVRGISSMGTLIEREGFRLPNGSELFGNV